MKVVLEPGQTYEHFVQGPKHMDINKSNLFQAKGYLGIKLQKTTNKLLRLLVNLMRVNRIVL